MRCFLTTLLFLLPLASGAEESDAEKEPLRAQNVILQHLQENVDLDNHGLRYRHRVVRDQQDPPLKFEIEGPIHNERNSFGLKITVRF